MSAVRFAHSQRRERGFTLVEVIIVLVVTGILSGIVALFIQTPVKNYIRAKTNADLSDAADTALRRIRRDVRLALPNSVRLSGNALEFILTKSGGRYLSVDDNQVAPRLPLSFTPNANALKFDVVGLMPAGVQQIVNDDRIVVYNLGPGFSPADAYAGGNIATVTGVAGNTITLATNPFVLQSPTMESPTRRFQSISGPVTYLCRPYSTGGDGTLVRFAGYALAQIQPNPPNATSTLVASNVQDCEFTYDTLVNEPRGLIRLALVLRDPKDANITVSLSLQVHVDNTP
jgi:MSHA biogenesis protein MshO